MVDARGEMLLLGKAPRGVLATFWLSVALLGGYATHTQFGTGGQALDRFFHDWVKLAIVLLSAGLCATRAIREPRERLAWALLSIGLASWALGNVYSAVLPIDVHPLPVPSVSDWLWLAVYPFACTGLALLLRRRMASFRLSACLDGIIAASATAALSAAIVVQAVLETSGHGTRTEVATKLAYPIGDLLLLGLIVGALALGGWRLDRVWASLAGGVIAFAITQGIYLYQVPDGTHVVAIADAGGLLAAVLIAHAAWQPATARMETAGIGRWQLRVPGAFALVSLGLLIYAHYRETNPLALYLSAATIVAVVWRMALSVRENAGMLDLSRSEATTDALTGLGNRRRLLADLDEALRRVAQRARYRLLLLDLNGFKAYNDEYGHHAGDALLARLATQLKDAVGVAGRAYRLGGDEFCVLLDDGCEETLVDEAVAEALSERGDGFWISAAHGSVLLPAEATDARAALRLVDVRMYADKSGSRPSPGEQASRALLQAQREANALLGDHVCGVAELSVTVGEALGCTPTELHDIRLAAELHDVGKIAIPAAILDKPGPLTADEWSFIHQHTLIGERILAAAPALQPAARLVRCCHEHFDGNGYPDGLVGSTIPLGARVIAACDAFDAMTRRRCYRTPVPADEALEELQRCAGSQFDPDVIDALELLLHRAGAVVLAA
jgi:two-component system, cell cycle response regulator